MSTAEVKKMIIENDWEKKWNLKDNFDRTFDTKQNRDKLVSAVVDKFNGMEDWEKNTIK